MYVFLFNTLLLLTIAHIKVAVTMILLLFSVFTSIYQPMYVIFLELFMTFAEDDY